MYILTYITNSELHDVVWGKPRSWRLNIWPSSSTDLNNFGPKKCGVFKQESETGEENVMEGLLFFSGYSPQSVGLSNEYPLYTKHSPATRQITNTGNWILWSDQMSVWLMVTLDGWYCVSTLLYCCLTRL